MLQAHFGDEEIYFKFENQRKHFVFIDKNMKRFFLIWKQLLFVTDGFKGKKENKKGYFKVCWQYGLDQNF